MADKAGSGNESPSMTRSVIWSWGGHFIFIITGFLLPRFIDKNLGVTTLGVWDFAWSLQGYLSLVQLGTGSSVNRFVAKYRAENDFDGLNRAVTSVNFLQMILASLIMIITVSLVVLIPSVWKAKLGNQVFTAQCLLMLLGGSTAFRFALGTYSGILTGYHRWDIYNGINSGAHAVTVVAMLVIIKAGFGIVAVAIVYAGGEVAAALVQVVAVYRITRDIKIRFKYFNMTQALSMLSFGGKSFIFTLARALFYQTSGIFILTFIGPAALALYSRPMSLINHLRTFSSKFANILVPVVSQLESGENKGEIERLFYRMSKFCVCMSLPPIVFLSVLGGTVMSLWMGNKYASGMLVLVLAIGHLATIANQPLFCVLMGLNKHGVPAIVTLVTAVISSAVCFVVLKFVSSSIIIVALFIVVSITLTDGLFLMAYACRVLKVPFSQYMIEVWVKAIAYVVPYTATLLIIKAFFSPLVTITLGLAAFGVVALPIYWVKVFPDNFKRRITEAIPFRKLR
jgi:O-antigen/teichoic acid export membrane protein